MENAREAHKNAINIAERAIEIKHEFESKN